MKLTIRELRQILSEMDNNQKVSELRNDLFNCEDQEQEINVNILRCIKNNNAKYSNLK